MKQKRKQLPEKQQPADGKLLQWHPAFYADLQIEFREESAVSGCYGDHSKSKRESIKGGEKRYV
ncbi:hypothetical protein [Mediterraneibacter faecis]|uniref:hypothetical protein n=1 Tax=Mediterraneibacter faecis TaxID=592978 RepID=UPI001D05FE52|nr:hypothetical protein [Mediterraneibacter faecis]MCB5889017.1 hypothetical protein [Lachnospiraceae bacterium 210521-DFI.4.71]MCB7113206.1 hypothetical protein [Mediterraneibacter faecis]MCB7116854.1 hypothetical protein [Mediterraneibacter faecis]MCB7288276.1 hypothetical protein [Mediterraneibacter faecis]MCB7423494.1 hypothetical protein [Mediterraneibacter faecis]